MFDLDGTLTRRDTLVGFAIAYFRQRPSCLFLLPSLAFGLIVAALKGEGRDGLKERAMVAIFGGAARHAIDVVAARFVQRLILYGMRPRGMSKLCRHLAVGDKVILVSASTDLYVPLIAATLGCHDCHCTRIEWNGDTVIGRFVGANLRGLEKASLLRKLRLEWSGRIVAYGNAASDLPHLIEVDEGVLVTRNRCLRSRARRLGVRVERW